MIRELPRVAPAPPGKPVRAEAAGWEDSRGRYRRPVLAGALARGGPFLPGRAVEIASGTGLLTPLIAAVWPEVAAVDLSGGMLARSAASGRIQADAARLPLAVQPHADGH
ncbi:MAG TPA: hypothetical protein VHO07_26060 [Streptosporangiaceae bacterium]|nr:hypothetical protein [Streptosporangiaceae bacterium]